MMSSGDTHLPEHTSLARNELTLPPLDSSNPKALLQRLIRLVMFTFDTPKKALVLEYLYHHKKVTELELAARLKMPQKEVRSIVQEMKRKKFVKECHRREENVDFYSFDEHMFINLVKYRLIRMRDSIENCERQQIDQQLSFKCEQCAEKFNQDKILGLFNAVKGELICVHCNGIVVEDTTTKETEIGSITRMAEFNVQMDPLFDVLKAIDILTEQKGGWSTAEDEESMDVDGASASEKKEVSYTPKPIPPWFIEPKIDVEEEGRLATINTQVTPASFSSAKANVILANDTEQMLLVSERKKMLNSDDLLHLFIVRPPSLSPVAGTDTSLDGDETILHDDQNAFDIRSNNY